MQPNPVVSIVIVNKNHGEMLNHTLRSYRNQTFKKSELICVDGRSTDNSLSVLSKYPDIVLISEDDKSGAEAFAKGITKARTEYIILGNSTDFLIDREFVASAVELLENDQAVSLVFGKVAIYDSSSGVYNVLESYTSDNFGDYKKNFSNWLIHGETFHEHACVIRRKVFDALFADLGDYSKSIEKLGDDLFLTLRYRFHAYGFRAEFIPLDVLAVVNHENRISVNQRRFFLQHLDLYNLQMRNFRKNFIRGERYKFVSAMGTDTEAMSWMLALKLKLILVYLELRGLLGKLHRKISN